VNIRNRYRRIPRGCSFECDYSIHVGLLLSLFTAGAGLLPILIGLVSGVGFGLASAAFRYAATKGQRDFVSHSQLVARRYDVLSQPRTAEHGRNLLAALALKAPLTV
jgi:hypothetical protein